MKEALALHQPEVAFAIAGHHSGLPDGGSKTDNDTTGTLFGRQKKDIPNYDTWRREIQPVKAERPSQIPRDNFSESFYIRMLFSCLVDADYQDTQNFMEGPPPRGGYSTPAALLEKLQRRYDEQESGLALLRFEPDRWQMTTRPYYGEVVKRILDTRRNAPLSPAALHRHEAFGKGPD